MKRACFYGMLIIMLLPTTCIAQRIAVLILGMHRSGTSATAGVFYLLGHSLGNTLHSANQYNPKGFFEDNDFMKLNDSILVRYKTQWDDVRPFRIPFSRLTLNCKNEIKALIMQKFGAHSVFCIKDPRLCLLLPLYIAALTELKY